MDLNIDPTPMDDSTFQNALAQCAMAGVDLMWLVANAHEVTLTCNGHRGYYDTAAKALADAASMNKDEDPFKDYTGTERAEVDAFDILYHLQVYPLTPVGFYDIYGTNLPAMLRDMRETVQPEIDARRAHDASQA